MDNDYSMNTKQFSAISAYRDSISKEGQPGENFQTDRKQAQKKISHRSQTLKTKNGRQLKSSARYKKQKR